MDEIWVRAGFVLALLITAGAIALLQRRGAEREVREIEVSLLADGTYFFSSAICSTCRTARHMLDEHLGPDGYTEYSWEREPERFERLGIGEVPATLIVSGGRGRLYPGQPGRALDGL